MTPETIDTILALIKWMIGTGIGISVLFLSAYIFIDNRRHEGRKSLENTLRSLVSGQELQGHTLATMQKSLNVVNERLQRKGDKLDEVEKRVIVLEQKSNCK